MKPQIKTLNIILALLLVSLPYGNLYAGPGHDHGEGAVNYVGANAPKRLPNGNVYLPKLSQRQLGLRTTVVEFGEFEQATELAGKVVADPNYGGKVQAMVTGRISPPPAGFPVPGQKVEKGQVLAYVTPDVGPGTTRSLAESRLKRLQALSDTVPKKSLEEAQAAVANEELRAPVAGTIATTGIVAGQVVDARQMVFEIVNPNRFLIEAIAYDPALLDRISTANLVVDDQVIPLKLLGGAKSLREQAVPITFAAEDDRLAKLAMGQPVRVYVQSGPKKSGFKIPASALVRNGSNQSVVWTKEGPQLFESQVVVEEPLDGTHVLVQGLHPDDRVVSKSASLLNQIR